VTFSGLSHERLLRAAMALGALAALFVALAPLGKLTQGHSRDHEGLIVTLDVEQVVGIIGAVACVVVIAAIFAPWGWARFVGVLAMSAAATTSGIELVRGRISETFVADERTTLLGGGQLLTAAFWVAVVAIGLVLLALRQIAMARPQEPEERLEAMVMRPDGRPLRTSMKATLGVALGLGGIIAPVLAGVAAAVSVAALGDVRAHAGRLGGRGMAIAGIVLGTIGLSLMIAILGVGAIILTPGT